MFFIAAFLNNDSQGSHSVVKSPKEFCGPVYFSHLRDELDFEKRKVAGKKHDSDL